MNKFKEMFRVLKYRNFRLFFPGLATSQIGMWIQNIAINWLVYDITKSPFIMGTVMFFNAIPLLLLTPFAGVIVDKFNRHKLLMAVQILFALQALLMSILTFLGLIKVWNIILLGFFLSCIMAIDMPLRQSTFVCLVDDKKDLGNAISLNSSCFNLARLVGPAIGGFIIAYVNVSACFFVNFICLLPAIYLVSKMRITDVKCERVKNETIFEGLKEGIEYAFKTPQILNLIAYIGFFCFLIMVYPMLLPIYTAEILHANADVLGILLGAAGVGSLISSLLIAMKTTSRNLRTIIFFGQMIACSCFICIGFTKSQYLALALMFVLGFGSTGIVTPENMLLQKVIDDDKRGRVMSLQTLCFMGTTSLSCFFAGSVAHILGVLNTFICLGSIMLIIGIIISYRLSKLKF